MTLRRNLDLKNGLCTGTRMIIVKMETYILTCKIISGKGIGKIIFLPRIDLKTTPQDLPFVMIRRLFPIKLGFAITINGVQGESFTNVGIYLRTQVFSHGHLYVAMSRVRSKDNLKIWISEECICKVEEYTNSSKSKKRKKDKITKFYIKNIVYEELFDD